MHIKAWFAGFVSVKSRKCLFVVVSLGMLVQYIAGLCV